MVVEWDFAVFNHLVIFLLFFFVLFCGDLSKLESNIELIYDC